MLEPSTSVQYVKGIGPRLAEVLSAKGIHTVDDLVHYLPFRYEDRLNPREDCRAAGGGDGDRHCRGEKFRPVSHKADADFSDGCRTGPDQAQMLVVQRDLFTRQVQGRADGGALREGRAGPQLGDCN